MTMRTAYLGRPTRPIHRAALAARVARVVDYLFGILYALFVVRLALEFFRARRDAGFVEFIRSVTDPFYAPFRAIVGNDSVDGQPIVWSIVVAILGYVLLHAAIRGLLRLVARS
jgi:uncharacterized protein YggT (Ycf19 family)